MLDPAVLARITDDLVDQSYSVHALGPSTMSAGLRELACGRERRGELREAGVGRSDDHHVDPAIRGDRIAWLDAANPGEAPYLAELDRLAAHLSRELFLGIRDHEAHFARFGPGAFYHRHLDRFRHQGARVVSTVLYLNHAWQRGSGGALRIYTPDHPARAALDVEPEDGTFVCFLSDRVWHEVLPTDRARLSVAGWLRQALVL